MGEAEGSSRKTKTISVDPSTLVVGGSRGSRRANSKSGADGSRRTTITRRSRGETKAEVEAKSAAVQEAVMKALMTQTMPPPPPPPAASSTHAEPHTPPSALTHTVTFNSGSPPAASTTPPSSPGPRSVNAVQNALHDLNKLIEDRARERARKTIRAQRRRGEAAYAPAPRNVTPLEPNSTAANNNRNSPPWGCLKGGTLPTFREHMRTQRAKRKSNIKLHGSPSQTTPKVRIQTPKEAATSAATSEAPNTTPPPLADTVITVGRKDNGRVAFVVGSHGTRRNSRHQRGQRSVTNRAKLRKARLLKGGNRAPQHLVDVIAESVDIIGDVVRPEPDTTVTVHA